MSIRKNKKLQQEQVIHQKDQTFLQSVGITRTVERPREESDIQLREDRIGRYFRKYLNKFVFVEFSEEFIAQSKAGDLLKGVPVPLRKKEVKDFAGGKGINFLVLAENMAWVMGCDPHFKHTKDYCAILHRLYNKKLTEGMLKEGRDAAEQGEMDNACIHFRAALCMQFDYMHAMYSYARACRVMYENRSMLDVSRRSPLNGSSFLPRPIRDLPWDIITWDTHTLTWDYTARLSWHGRAS